MTFIGNACWAFAPSTDTCPSKITIAASARYFYPNKNQRVVSAIRVKEQVSGGQMSDHMWCLCIRVCVCGDKTSCPPWLLNGGCIEIAPDNNLIGLHLPRTATAEREARYTRRGSRCNLKFYLITILQEQFARR